jgi:hypothetical protein
MQFLGLGEYRSDFPFSRIIHQEFRMWFSLKNSIQSFLEVIAIGMVPRQALDIKRSKDAVLSEALRRGNKETARHGLLALTCYITYD